MHRGSKELGDNACKSSKEIFKRVFKKVTKQARGYVKEPQ